jgi:hypothetical protein
MRKARSKDRAFCFPSPRTGRLTGFELKNILSSAAGATKMVRNTYLVEGEARSRRRPPGLKSFLIALNIQVDWLLDSIRSIEYSWDPIIWHDGHSEIERLTLLLEDRRYYRHSGFDPWCIPRVVRQALTFKRIGGVAAGFLAPFFHLNRALARGQGEEISIPTSYPPKPRLASPSSASCGDVPDV